MPDPDDLALLQSASREAGKLALKYFGGDYKRWNKAGGKVLPGLTRRRASEALLFQSIPDKNFDGVPD